MKPNEEGNHQAAKSPIVFQCASCRRIVGDSLGLINADEDLRQITLQGACEVVRSPCPRTSEDGKDLGSAYHDLFCAGCNVQLGKVYLTTAPHLDSIRNLFTFDTDALESYELGNYDHICDLPHLPPIGSFVLPPATAGEHGASNNEQDTMRKSFETELTKLQNLMLVFHDRISSLEKEMLQMQTVGTTPKAKPSTTTTTTPMSKNKSILENLPRLSHEGKRKRG